MSISVYLVIKAEEMPNYPKNLLVQMNCGFHANGSVRLPIPPIRNIVMIDDLNLPNFSASALQILRSKITNGCILDFEREPNNLHKRLIQGLQDKRVIAIPEKFYSFARGAFPMVSCPDPCNSYLQFVTNTQKRYPNGWMLEITPWNHERTGTSKQTEGFLTNALCYFKKQNDKVIYYDTKESVAQKLKSAQQHGCKAAIALYSEVKNLR